MSGEHTSNCSLGVPLQYYWYGPRVPGATHVDAAVDAVVEAITTPQRRWSPYNKAMAMAEIRNRLEAAQRGELTPIDHVKCLDGGERQCLFEIRWQGITVHEVDDKGDVSYPSIQARLIHSEPSVLSIDAVGLHAHEKVFYEGDSLRTRHEQDAHIGEAVARYLEGESARWGIL